MKICRLPGENVACLRWRARECATIEPCRRIILGDTDFLRRFAVASRDFERRLCGLPQIGQPMKNYLPSQAGKEDPGPTDQPSLAIAPERRVRQGGIGVPGRALGSTGAVRRYPRAGRGAASARPHRGSGWSAGRGLAHASKRCRRTAQLRQPARQTGRPQESLAIYDKAIALKADLAEAHINRGNVLLELRRYDEALASYERALVLRPDRSRRSTGAPTSTSG